MNCLKCEHHKTIAWDVWCYHSGVHCRQIGPMEFPEFSTIEERGLPQRPIPVWCPLTKDVTPFTPLEMVE